MDFPKERIVVSNQPCLSCASSDARQIYESGTSYCFSCLKYFGKKGMVERAPVPNFRRVTDTHTIEHIKGLQSRALPVRGISKEVCQYFGVKVELDSDNEISTHYYPYEHGYKVRKLPKDFSWVGQAGGVFGKSCFPGANTRLIVAEGEIDALSLAEAAYRKYQKIYPVIGLSSSSATKELIAIREWARKHDEIILCFDEDEAGQKAVGEAARILGYDKVKVARLPLNDANEVLLKRSSAELLNCIFNATRYVPSGIISKEAIWDALEKYNQIESVPYPECLSGLNSKLKGMRFGEIALYISGTGSGKSSLIREIIYHLLETTTEKIGIVALEESPAETARKLSSLVLNKNSAKEEIPLDELKVGFDKIFADDRIVLLDHQGAISDNGIVDQLEYMALIGCKYIFIDHITILVSEGVEGLTGNESQDKMMNSLLKLVKRHDVHIGLVSHLRKTPNQSKSFEEGKLPNLDSIRGSGSVKQISMDVIGFSRDMTSNDEHVRNRINMAVLKCRHTGLTGEVTGCTYIFNTGRLIKNVDEFHAID